PAGPGGRQADRGRADLPGADPGHRGPRVPGHRDRPLTRPGSTDRAAPGWQRVADSIRRTVPARPAWGAQHRVGGTHRDSTGWASAWRVASGGQHPGNAAPAGRRVRYRRRLPAGLRRVGGVTRHIVWDWNGTLLDDNHAVVAAVNAVCAAYQHPAITLDEWRAVFCRPLDRCYERLLGQALSTEDWHRIDRVYHDTYHALLPDQRLAAGAREALRTWRAAGGTQSLLSMWFHDELVRLVGELGLAADFDRIDGLRTEVGGGPKAEHLAEHLAALALDPSDVVLIGDVVDDAAAAASVRARRILPSTGISPQANLQQ